MDSSLPATKSSQCIHLVSMPRCCSTALMYSFAQRSDTTVVDEPTYAHWLFNHPEIRRSPGERESTIESQSIEPEKINEIMHDAQGKAFVFNKHISKMLEGFDLESLFGSGDKLIFLIRNPWKVLSSFTEVAETNLMEIGLMDSYDLYYKCCNVAEKNGLEKPLIIDTDLLTEDPERVLKLVCSHLQMDWDKKMLSWPPGPKPYDGIWASTWYKTLHSSTGFNKSPAYSKFSFELYPVLEQAMPFYISLKNIADKALVSTPPIPVPQNKQLLIWVGDGLYPRELAKVSVFDSSVQGGDAVWEGIRVYDGRIFALNEHLNRLFDSAKAMQFQNIPSKEFIQKAIFQTLAANGMRDGAHMRLTLSRGKKVTSGMSPHFNQYGCVLIILAEFKPPVYNNQQGVCLVTASQRRNSPQSVDSKIHHCNLINNILAKIEANNAGAADAIMLDRDGYVSETNATNIFIVKNETIHTPHADYCLPGITRQKIIQIARDCGYPLEVKRISLSEVHSADEVFTTGSMGEVTPVVMVDGRLIGPSDIENMKDFNGSVIPFCWAEQAPTLDRVAGLETMTMTKQIQQKYKELTEVEGVPLPF